MPASTTNRAIGRFGKQRFVYSAERDDYRCPAGAILACTGHPMRHGQSVRRYTTPACASCALRQSCTGAKRQRREITRAPHADAVEAMARRVQDHPDKIKRRKELVEHPFGTIKRTMNQGYFLLKRFPKVTTEMSLTVLCYNLRRVMNIPGANALMQQWAVA